MSRSAHTNTNAWWLQPDEYLGPPTKEYRHGCGVALAAPTPDELKLLREQHEKVCAA